MRMSKEQEVKKDYKRRGVKKRTNKCRENEEMVARRDVRK
jgi:hypothetical protein